jgi:hypothetical protein
MFLKFTPQGDLSEERKLPSSATTYRELPGQRERTILSCRSARQAQDHSNSVPSSDA